MWIGLLLGVSLATPLSGCGAEELSSHGGVVCEEIARTIANVSWSCGLSLEAANARGRGFSEAYTCTGPTTPAGEYQLEVGLRCPVSMAHVPCALADAAGDDYAQWVAAVPACADIAVPVGTEGGS